MTKGRYRCAFSHRETVLVLLTLLAAGRGARAEGWRHFHIILWQTPTPAQIPALKRLGVEATKIIANRSGKGPLVDQAQIAPLLKGGMRWYVENIATDFYAAYHRWHPHAPVNATFLAAQRAHQADPASLAPFMRQPSLSDPAALAAITTRLRQTVHAWAPYRPLFYNLGDETGIADLAANWDFDFSPASLSGFRTWLHSQYTSLAALNTEWDTQYARWDEVMPITTTAAMARADDNFAPWSDFKAWMDTAFARAVRAGTDAVRAADPAALAGIEGAQIPGWGGYDYAKLAGVVDVMEIYDAGANLAMARSFNPRLVLLTTSFDSGPAAVREIWQEALRGTGGLILWDPDNKLVQADGSVGPRGRELAATFAALHGPAADLLLRAPLVVQPVAIMASQASFRVRWLLEHRIAGDAWSKRSAADEWDDASLRAGPDRFAAALRRIGIAPRFVSDVQVAGGALGTLRAVILPDVLALSPQAAAAIRAFAARGGLVIAEGNTGHFDAHGRRLPHPLLAGLTLRRLKESEVTPDRLHTLLAGAGVQPGFRLLGSDGATARDVDAYTRTEGDRLILALQTAKGGGPVVLALPHPRSITDLLAGKELGRTDRLSITLDPAVPTLLAIGPTDGDPAPQ